MDIEKNKIEIEENSESVDENSIEVISEELDEETADEQSTDNEKQPTKETLNEKPLNQAQEKKFNYSEAMSINGIIRTQLGYIDRVDGVLAYHKQYAAEHPEVVAQWPEIEGFEFLEKFQKVQHAALTLTQQLVSLHLPHLQAESDARKKTAPKCSKSSSTVSKPVPSTNTSTFKPVTKPKVEDLMTDLFGGEA